MLLQANLSNALIFNRLLESIFLYNLWHEQGISLILKKNQDQTIENKPILPTDDNNLKSE